MARVIKSTAMVLGAVIMTVSGVPALAERPVPPIMRGLEPDEKVGRVIDLDLEFVNEGNQIVPLSRYFNKGRPVILNFVYYRCPMLCNLVLNGQTAAMRELKWTPGNEYDVVTLSIDPEETPEHASKKKAVYMSSLDRPGATGWHFLSDFRGNAKKLADQVGFKYRFDEQQKQYVHPAVILVLTPEAKVARYLYGTRFKTFDLRMALAEALEGRGKFSAEKALLLCYQYDPNAHSYVVAATNIMRGGALLTVIILGLMLRHFFKWEKERAAQWKASQIGNGGAAGSGGVDAPRPSGAA